MILIVESGATKAEWCLLKGSDSSRVLTQGISPYFYTSNQIQSIIKNELLPYLNAGQPVSHIYYYGTGCNNAQSVLVVQLALDSLFPSSEKHITHDLMASAHAVCGHRGGVVAILGTGSNSGYYDGQKFVVNHPSLGYILGDEGSGAYLGKKILQSYFYNQFSKEIKEEFESEFGVTEFQILREVYQHPTPNRYLASFSVFLSNHRGNELVEKILQEGIGDFFCNHLQVYPESITGQVHFTGSIAWYYRDVVLSLCRKFGYQAGHIIKNPLDNLVAFYLDAK